MSDRGWWIGLGVIAAAVAIELVSGVGALAGLGIAVVAGLIGVLVWSFSGSRVEHRRTDEQPSPSEQGLW